MTYTLHVGDCREVMRGMADASADAVVTDPPYEISFMGKRWDATGIAYDVGMWREVLRVLKPGGHLLAFGGTRTYHRMACAIEDAGFEIRDAIGNMMGPCFSLEWAHGQGFPKSLNVSKEIDRRAGVERRVVGSKMGLPGYTLSASDGGSVLGDGVSTKTPEQRIRETEITEPATPEAAAWDGWGTALKPAHEPIVLARKPMGTLTVAATVLKHGTGGLNVDACRVGTTKDVPASPSTSRRMDFGYGARADSIGHDPNIGRWPPNLLLTHSTDCKRTGTRTVKGDSRAGQDPGSRQASFFDVGSPLGDGKPCGPVYGDADVGVWECAPDCPVGELDRQSGELTSGGGYSASTASEGGASRFFPVFEWTDEDRWPFRYVAKPDRSERDAGLGSLKKTSGNSITGRQADSAGAKHSARAGTTQTPRGNSHPTVKPIALMQWLCRLITPPGGTILDPFTGSGTTLIAALRCGFNAIGIELSEDYARIARLRVEEDAPLFQRTAGAP